MSSNNILLYGGLKGEDSNDEVFSFSSQTNTWTAVQFSVSKINPLHLSQKESAKILPRDDHTLCDCGDGSFMVFGGFVNGYRVDELLKFTTANMNISCEELSGGSTGKHGPKPRTAHTSGFFNNHFYVYGGQDDENNKLGDLWDYDCTSKNWSEISLTDENGYGPNPRSGHSCVVNNGKMFIFGGIFELTKELNDMLIYDCESKKCSHTGVDSPGSPKK